MSGGGNASKIVIIVLVALGALYVVVFVLGATRASDEKLDLSAESWTQTIHDLLVQSQGLEAKDVKVAAGSNAGCWQDDAFVVPANGTCDYDIAKTAGQTVRDVKLALQTGQSIEVALKQEGSLTAKQTLTGTQPLKGLSVQQAGGTLSLICRAGDQQKECRLVLQ